jgi:hypothetical protein
MEVRIKDFTVDMDVKTKGIEFEVRDTTGKFLGDCYVTKTGLEWCNGKTTQGKGKKIVWEKFISNMMKQA